MQATISKCIIWKLFNLLRFLYSFVSTEGSSVLRQLLLNFTKALNFLGFVRWEKKDLNVIKPCSKNSMTLSQRRYMYRVPEPTPGVVNLLSGSTALESAFSVCSSCDCSHADVWGPTGPGPHMCRRQSSNKSLKVKHDRHTAITPLLWSVILLYSAD